MVLPVLVLLLLLAVDVGRVYFTTIDLRNAAHEATMFGGTEPRATCAQLKAVVDQEMGRTSQPNAALCSPLTTATDVPHIVMSRCERADPGPGCSPWNPNYPADADLRYAVRIEYRFQPVLPLVGALTGNGMGGSLPISVENRSPVLVGYEGS